MVAGVKHGNVEAPPKRLGKSHRWFEVPAAQIPLGHQQHALHGILDLAQTARAFSKR